ncbi:MAG: glycine cleavage system aminomethyltransferase GcvT [Egibacteraceae bacterium]
MSPLRRSPLHERHVALGAAMTPFAGWEMPLDYGSVVAEHRAVRESCGVFDLSHLGALRVTGLPAVTAVQWAFTNDAAALAVGRAHYTLCLDDRGGIVDDLLVYRLDWGFFVVPNAANSAAVFAVLEAAVAEAGACEVTDVKEGMACLAVQGPRSAEMITSAGVDVSGLGYLDCRPLSLGSARMPPGAGVLARSGYTGERGYELFTPAALAPALWNRLVEAGARPAGLGARDTLRLEMGYPLHGNDISTATSPVEASLGWAVKVGAPFRGRGAYLRAQADEPSRRLWGLRATGRGIPRAHCVVQQGGQAVGETTSGTFSPTLRVGLALAYLDAAVTEGVEVEIDVRGKPLPAQVVKPPFIDADPRG